jgi:hypothetical protein
MHNLTLKQGPSCSRATLRLISKDEVKFVKDTLALVKAKIVGGVEEATTAA